ncbi:hypothetical protein UA08_01166 [Talaromyces atroroseus]|uniref:Uncharacterized protein n=1 Tax=Talaromyces atroroseus TaxID=1441469 RepID=A0A1Q5QB69_TALAT|nr:hypothetical protein UA08_01166 [Talaromyces atroroseus]OKL63166.1 hypothetical protein UA08_01166 [Talaromyces atroroseus]
MDNNPRRELPPPAGMTLAPEPPVTSMVPSSQLPPLPSQWHTEDSLRQWLRTKAEEDRRRQEEERTRQETLKLEQRRVERSMLHDAIQAGVPPQLVPFIFIGIGGGNLARSSLDVAQQLDLSSVQQGHSQQPQKRAPLSQQQATPAQSTSRHPQQNLDLDSSQPLPSDIRRDSRTIPPNPYASQVAPMQVSSPSQPGPVSPPQTHGYRGSLQPTRLHVGGESQSHQPRLNANEFHVTHVGPAQFQRGITGSSHGPVSAPPPHAKPETQPSQSPSIHFHHWVPPGQTQPSTPSTRGRQESSTRSHPHSESQTSPGRKRKAPGSHPPPPPPTPHHEQASPAPSTASPGRGTPMQTGHNSSHSRQQSDPSHGFRHQENSETNADNLQRYRPTRESILNPLESSSRRTSTDAQPGSTHARSEREH